MNRELTNCEKKVVTELLKGIPNKEIAENLDVSVKTVKFHLTNIYAKISVKNREQAIISLTGNKLFPGSIK